MNSNDFLSHYGVKGMQWGVRRSNLRSSNAAVKEAKAKLKAAKKERSQARSELAKPLAKIAVPAVAAVGLTAAAIALKKSGSKKVNTIQPPEWPFSSSGANHSIKAKDGRTFDLLVQLYSEQQSK